MKNVAEIFLPELSRKRAKTSSSFNVCVVYIFTSAQNHTVLAREKKREGRCGRVHAGSGLWEAAVFDDESLVGYLCMTEGGVGVCTLYSVHSTSPSPITQGADPRPPFL
jgi:hypothetical protein